MIPGDFQLSRPSRDKLAIVGTLGVVGLGLFGGAALVITFIISAWLGRPVVFGYTEGPDQPIGFTHITHARLLELDCTFCHRNVTRGDAATIPSVGLCMTCHKTVGDQLPEVEKLRAIYQQGLPIDWVRVHRLPDHTHFAHEPHVRALSQQDGVAPSAVCSTCHGDVGAMVKVRQVRSLKMGDCVDCHRDNSAPTDCATCHY